MQTTEWTQEGHPGKLYTQRGTAPVYKKPGSVRPAYSRFQAKSKDQKILEEGGGAGLVTFKLAQKRS